MEMQPNAGAPLLRTERARREWVEQELDLCNTSWDYMKVGASVSGGGGFKLLVAAGHGGTGCASIQSTTATQCA